MPTGQNVAGGRDASTGRFTAGNIASLKHGERSTRNAVQIRPELAAALKEIEQEILNDLGGEQNLSELRRDLVRQHIQARVIRDSLAENIATQGVISTKGRTRAAVTLYLQVADRVLRTAMALGLERRAKTVSDVPSLDAYLKQETDEGMQPTGNQ